MEIGTGGRGPIPEWDDPNKSSDDGSYHQRPLKQTHFEVGDVHTLHWASPRNGPQFPSLLLPPRVSLPPSTDSQYVLLFYYFPFYFPNIV